MALSLGCDRQEALCVYYGGLLRAALPLEETLRQPRAGIGTQWDPQVASAFLSLLEQDRLPRFEGTLSPRHSR